MRHFVPAGAAKAGFVFPYFYLLDFLGSAVPVDIRDIVKCNADSIGRKLANRRREWSECKGKWLRKGGMAARLARYWRGLAVEYTHATFSSPW